MNIKISIIKNFKSFFVSIVNIFIAFTNYEVVLKKKDKIKKLILSIKKKNFSERKKNFLDLNKKYKDNYNLLREYCLDLFYNCDLEYVKRFNELNYLREELIRKSFGNFENDFIRNFYFKGSFGNILCIWAYLESIKLEFSHKKNLIFFNDSKKITNLHIFKYFKKHIIEHKLINPYHNLDFQNEILWPDIGDYTPMKNSAPTLNFAINKILSEKKLKNVSESFFKLSEDDKILGKKILREFGINTSSWHVTLHVRTSGYRTGDKDYFRNADIFNYLPAIEKVIKNGGIVFRVGDKSMPALPRIKGLIDYCHTTLKSDFMDVYLAATSKFIIGSSSGYWTLGRLFNVPVLLTNMSSISQYYLMTENDVVLPKKFYKKNNPNNLMIKDLFNPNIAIGVFAQNYLKNNFIIEDNTSEELKIATDIMIQNIIFNNKSQKINVNKNLKLLHEITNKYGQIFTTNKINSFATIPDHILKNYLEFN
jgi:hypothetical protein